VIRGVGVNNDGGASVGFTAPSVEGQADAISQAWASAGVSPATVGYVEAHGTATPLGDPIEFAGLVRAFRSSGANGSGSCALGSAKANVGHLDAAAGVTGLITAAMALHTGRLPPLAHFDRPNPQIDLESSPFYINRDPRDWPAGPTPRRAGVSSFGVGGTNVHIALEQAPPRADRPVLAQDGAVQVLPLSARSCGAVQRAAAALAGCLRETEVDIADVAATLQSARRVFPHRAFVLAGDPAVAATALAGGLAVRESPPAPPRVVFMFSGQGSQSPGMARDLYQAEPEFRRWIDAGLAKMDRQAASDLKSMLLEPAGRDAAADHPIHDTANAQPALFLVEYALAKLWMHRGVQPAAMIGHSVGELVAAALSGVLSFEDALGFILRRGELMRDTPQGGMLSVRLSEAVLAEMLPEDLDLAAVNAPELTVVAGPLDALELFERQLDAREVGHRRLHTSRAFHSRMMDRAVEGLAEDASTLNFALPEIPFVSSTTGEWVPADRRLNGAYWSAHCRATVRFADGLRTVLAAGPAVLLEVGPGRALSTFARQVAPGKEAAAVIASLPDPQSGGDARTALADATGRLWQAGVDLEWPAVRGDAGRRINLPGYSFEPERHMFDSPAPVLTAAPAQVPAPAQFLPSSAPAIQIDTVETATELPHMPQTPGAARTLRLIADVTDLLSEMSGMPRETLDSNATFWDLGYDSLFMGQVAQKLRRRHGIVVTFRQIMSDLPSIAQLAAWLDAQLPPDAEPVAPAAVPLSAPAQTLGGGLLTTPLAAPGDVSAIINNQLMVMQALFERQLQALGAQPSAGPQAASGAPTAIIPPTVTGSAAVLPAPATSRFKPFTRNDTAAQMTELQQSHIAALVGQYLAKSPTSRARTQTYRRVLADPRTASGFSEDWKDIVYPVVASRAKGSRIWDTDGNEYIDLVNGYGQTAFGHSPDFVIEAVNQQMAEGFAIGPQTPLAGEVAEMFADITGHERVTFCNTGSEAVMAAMRLARTVTGKDTVVCFDGDYHGQFDEVLVKPGGRAASPGALPLAPGILRTSVSNMVVLSYGAADSLDWIRSHIDEIAAVLVEPVQSRHPALQPRAFVAELRALTAANDSALIIDEVVTGFRAGPAGMQGVWGVQADMATYGKVVGGGLPVGVLAGTSRFMDALDGGFWEYGDASVPEVAPTFFAGTFVRHPLVLAAMKAVLTHIRAVGPELYEQLPKKTAALVARLNQHLERAGLDVRAETYSSWFFLNMAAAGRLGSLFYAHMRLRGVHVLEGYPCFLTTAHSDADLAAIETAFVESLEAMSAAHMLGVPGSPSAVPLAAPLTEPQAEIWMAAQLGDEASMAFNESVRLDLSGPLQIEAFERSLIAAVARHDALSLRFSPVGDSMSAAAQSAITLVRSDARDAEDPNAVVAQAADEEARTPFDLSNGPVARARLTRTGEADWTFLFSAHHIVCDGWSMNVLLEDLKALYAAEVAGSAAALEDAQSFLAFARRQTEGGLDPDARRFWCDLHRMPAGPVDLPTDRPRPELKSFRGATVTRQISLETLASLKAASAGQGCSLFATLVGAVQVLFGRLSGSDDIVVAAPMAGQFIAADDAPLVGHCVNFLPLRTAFDRTTPFVRHMKAVRDHLQLAGNHQNYTLGALVRDLSLKRDLNRLPLTDIQFNFEKFDDASDMAGVRARFAPNPKAFVNYDLFINAIESGEGLRLDCDYSTDLYDGTTVHRWLGHLETLLRGISRDAATAIRDLPMLSEGEVRGLRDDLNRTARPFDADRTARQMILAQASQTPHRTALADGRACLTYAQLVEKSEQISAGLVAAGVSPGERVAIALERTVSPVAAMLAVWRVGCAYVPLDIASPPRRLEAILHLSGAAAVITDSGLRPSLPVGSWRLLFIEDLEIGGGTAPSSFDSRAEDAAYVIFTSGSTGAPKGVEVPHRALANFLIGMAERPGCNADDRIAAITTFAFDISGLELLLPLTVGGEVHVVPEDQAHSGKAMTEWVRSRGITLLQTTPSVWRLLLDTGFTPSPGLRAFCGGEPLTRDLADALLALKLELWNLYGPTETTIWSSADRVAPSGEILIGAPIANTQIHVLDDDRHLSPPGVAGDLWIGGAGVATGYLNQSGLTDASFQSFSVEGAPPARLYRTGDRAVRLTDGGLRVTGRSDNQIKLRGYRIDLEDVEAHLAAAPNIQAGAVALRQINGSDRLVGYVVAAGGAVPDGEALAAHFAERLPGYMTPSHWVTLSALPLTVAGKLDRKALPVPEPTPEPAPSKTASAGPLAAGAPPEVPVSPLEARIAGIWASVLRLDQVDVTTKFFSLGPDSIQLFRIVARMNEQGMVVEARQLMKNVTVRELAQRLEQQSLATVVTRPSISDFKRQARRES
jgi:amino acid adenylation domain-containing protein